MPILVLSLVLFMPIIGAQAKADTSLIISGLSYHYNRTCPPEYICTPWNEQNYGMGLKKGQWSMGTYKNSYFDQSYFVGFQQAVKYGMGWGINIATGYYFIPLMPLPYAYLSLPINRDINVQFMQVGVSVASMVLEIKVR